MAAVAGAAVVVTVGAERVAGERVVELAAVAAVGAHPAVAVAATEALPAGALEALLVVAPPMPTR